MVSMAHAKKLNLCLISAGFAVLLSITSCGGGGSSSTAPPPTPPDPPTPTEPTPEPETPVTPTDPTPEPPAGPSDAQLQQGAAYAVVAKSSIATDPTIATATAAVSKLTAAFPEMAPAAFGDRIARAHDQALQQFKLTTQDRYYAHTLMLRALLSTFRDVPGAAKVLATVAEAVVPHSLLADNGRQMTFREIEGDLIDAIVDDTNDRCRASATASAQCDAALSPLYGVSVSDSAATICLKHEFAGCELLVKGKDVTEEELVRVVSKAQEKTLTKAQECMEADKKDKVSELCPSIIEVEEAKIDLTEAADFVTKYGEKIGVLDKDKIDLIKSSADIAAKAATGISIVYTSLDKFSLSKATDAITDWNTWKALIFKEGSLGDHAEIVNTVASLVAGFGDIGSAIKSLTKLFGASFGGDGSSPTEQAMLAQLIEIKRILLEFQAETRTRLDLIDWRLGALSVAMTNSLDKITGRLDGIQVSQSEMLSAQAELSNQITSLYTSVNEMIHDMQITQLNSVTATQRRVDRAAWDQQEVFVANILRSDVKNSIASGPSTYTNNVTDLFTLYSTNSLGYLVNLISVYPKVQLGSTTTYSSQRLASPIDTVHIGNIFYDLLAQYPEFSIGDPVAAGHIQEVRGTIISPLLEMHRSMQMDTRMFDGYLNDLVSASVGLQDAVNGRMTSFKRANETSKTDLESIDIYGAANQPTTHTPKFVAEGRIPGCSTPVSPITIPNNWKEVTSSNVALVAEALGIVDLKPCLDGVGPGPGGWSFYVEQKHKPDRYTASGGASYGIFLNALDSSGALFPVKMVRQDLPFKDEGYDKLVCIWFSTDTVRNAGAAHPVVAAISESWEGEYKSNGANYCATDGFRLQQTRQSWEGTRWPRTVAFDWETAGTAAFSTVSSGSESGLTDLRKRFATTVSSELNSSAAIGVAAKRYETARLALIMAIRYTYPSQSSISPSLLSLISGKDAIPSINDFTTYINGLAQSGASTPIVVNDAAEFRKKTDALRGILASTGDAVRSGQLADPMIELEALDARLEVMQEAVGR